jgi:alkylhydroperoxidase/carboxymuconolactone decarboxylase family protein YurZ
MRRNSSEQAWVKLPEVGTAEQASGRRNHPYDFGYVAGMSRLIMAHPRIAPAFGALYASIMFAPGALTRGEREMVAAVSAAAQDCHY